MYRFCIICNNIYERESKVDSRSYQCELQCCSSCLNKLYLNKLDRSYFNLDKADDPSVPSSMPFLLDQPTDSNFNVYSLFYYQNMIRDLILRAKVQKDHQALKLIESIIQLEFENIKKFCISFFQNTTTLTSTKINPSSSDSLLPSFFIIPVPSSLWSRIKGKYDISFMIAKTLSDLFGSKLIETSYKFGWNIFKRSKSLIKKQKNISTLNPSIKSNLKPNSSIQNHKNIIIVDDILTTGYTLKKIGSNPEYKQSKILYISFATSKSFFKPSKI